MRVLLDECLPERLRDELPGHQVRASLQRFGFGHPPRLLVMKRLVARLILEGVEPMRERRRGHSYCCRIPNVVAVTLLGIATGAGALNGVSAGAQEIRAVGANLIANADFDTGVAGWTPKWFSEGDDENAKSRGWSGSVKWAPGRDYAGRNTSGSLELAITAAEEDAPG